MPRLNALKPTFQPHSSGGWQAFPIHLSRRSAPVQIYTRLNTPHTHTCLSRLLSVYHTHIVVTTEQGDRLTTFKQALVNKQTTYNSQPFKHTSFPPLYLKCVLALRVLAIGRGDLATSPYGLGMGPICGSYSTHACPLPAHAPTGTCLAVSIFSGTCQARLRGVAITS